MRAMLFALAGLLVATFAAYAGEAEGKITAVDTEKMTITLEDGNSYKLPGEIDMTAIAEGKTVVVLYVELGETNQITDMIIDD